MQNHQTMRAKVNEIHGPMPQPLVQPSEPVQEVVPVTIKKKRK